MTTRRGAAARCSARARGGRLFRRGMAASIVRGRLVCNDEDPSHPASRLRATAPPASRRCRGMRRIPWLALALLLPLALGGCLLPNRGTPVFVDGRAGSYWSGKGMLLEVAPDRVKCRVAVRD